MQDILQFLQHHQLLASALIAILIIITILEVIKIRGNTHAISPIQLIQFINRENAIVVDLRPTDSYLNGHIVDAESIPAKELSDKIKKIEKYKNQPVVLVCVTGTESSHAITTLETKGFQRIYALKGGIQAWKSADMPLVKG